MIKVTVIDDEIEYVNDLAKGLEILGYEVSKAASGSHALEVIKRAKPDVVLCDYKLDDMDGTQVIEQARAENPGIICIIMTAYYDESFKEAFIKSGAAEVVYKPIQLTDLDNTIKKSLSR